MIRDPELTEQLLESVRRLVRERLLPAEARVADEDQIPPQLVQAMRDLGLPGLSIPEQYGGLGLTVEEEMLVVLELGYAAPAFRSTFGTNIGIGSQGLIMAGSEEQKQRFLPRLASGEAIASFCLTEPDTGSDAASVRTTARRDADRYLLNGSKRWITNGSSADLYTVIARVDPGPAGGDGISAFLVERGTPGVSTGRPYRKMGQQGAHVCDVVFDDVSVPAANRIGPEGTGFRTAMQVLVRGRLHIAAICTGLARRLIDESVAFALDRRQFGQRIADFQLIQAMLADSQAEYLAARSMMLETARRYDQQLASAAEVACCKLFASEMVGRVADRAVQIHGGTGYMRDCPVERLYRDVRLFRIYEGTSQIQQLIIARDLIRRAESGRA
jgi:acyl-CoA dehydrogenase